MTLSPRLKTILTWLDEHILLLLGGFLLVFIPLYPKIPLFSPIEQYIVRVRLEDVFVFLTGIVWLVQLLRKKITWKLPAGHFIFAYALAGALTLLTAVFVIKSIPLQPLHLGKSLLHYFRYLEYFSLFFILATAVKTRQHLKVLLGVLASTLLLVALYGIGQKYLYWPVYSTMNREFSKGIRLYLTEHARVQSTFAGHYDLGAYLVIVLPLVLGAFFTLKHKLLKLLMASSLILGLWLLIVSASRTSFAAAVVGMSLVVCLQALLKTGIWPKLRWAASRLFILYVLMGAMLFQFGDDIYERFLQVVDSNPEWHETYHTFNDQRKKIVSSTIAFVTGKSLDEQNELFKLMKVEPPKDGLAADENGIVSSDQRPVPTKPSDVYVDVPDYVQVSTVSATGETQTITVEQDRVFSECAKQRGLSLCIRLETLWPKAMAGFQENPLFGKGYATLNKDSVDQFTEAESTDNNFLRTLGETGLIGFVTFYGVIAVASLFLLKQYRRSDDFDKTIIGIYVAATVGLLINAVYIDVFAASKVAFAYWGLTGILVGYFYVRNNDATVTPQVAAANHQSKKKPANKKNRSSTK